MRVTLAIVLALSAGCSAGPGKTRAPRASTGEVRHGELVVRGGANVRVEEVMWPLPPLNKNLMLLSKGYEIEADLRAPATVTLRFDRSKLPRDATRDSVYPVLVDDELVERLPADRVDLEGGTVVFTLRRTRPLVDACGTRRAGQPYVAIGADARALSRLETGPAGDFAIWGRPEDARSLSVLAATIRSSLPDLRRRYESLGFGMPDFVHVEVVPLSEEVFAQASGGDRLQLNLNKLGAAAVEWKYVLAHEMFHLAQQISVKGFETGDEEIERQWLAESTAEWMAYKTVPEAAMGKDRVRSIGPEFFFRPLFDAGQPDRYRAMIFWSHLETRYDVLALLRRIYRRPKTRPAPDEVDPIGARALLRGLLATTPDRQGRTRSLKTVFVDFLLHAYWRKDVEPLAAHLNPASLGPKGEIRSPKARLTGWNLPGIKGRERVLQWEASWAPDLTAPTEFAIVSSVRIDSMTEPGEKGDLEVNLRVDGYGKEAEKGGFVVLFPFKKGLERPLFAAAGTPLRIRGWQEWAGALAWVIDVSEPGDDRFTLSARFVKEAPPDKGWAGDWVGTETIAQYWNDPKGVFKYKHDGKRREETSAQTLKIGAKDDGRWEVVTLPRICPILNSELKVNGAVVSGEFDREGAHYVVRYERSGDTIKGTVTSQRRWEGAKGYVAIEHFDRAFKVTKK